MIDPIAVRLRLLGERRKLLVAQVRFLIEMAEQLAEHSQRERPSDPDRENPRSKLPPRSAAAGSVADLPHHEELRRRPLLGIDPVVVSMEGPPHPAHATLRGFPLRPQLPALSSH
jgi:hypothetical protein